MTGNLLKHIQPLSNSVKKHMVSRYKTDSGVKYCEIFWIHHCTIVSLREILKNGVAYIAR